MLRLLRFLSFRYADAARHAIISLSPASSMLPAIDYRRFRHAS